VSIARALSIAGSDPGGGAGIQADLKTFSAHDVFGMTVITALTAQNTVGVHGVHEIPVDFVRAQFDAVFGDIGVDVVKTGMLSSAAIAGEVARCLREVGDAPVIVDPVCASQHGDPLLADDALEVLRQEVVPLAEVVTPNTAEVGLLTGVEVRGADDLRAAAEAMKALGPNWVLVKGGHLPDNTDAVDLLFDGEREIRISAERIDTVDTHGTGCTLASAVAANRARGLDVVDAVRAGKEFVTGAIRGGLRMGAGIGPVDHGWRRAHERAPRG
jgi:hydroxymethylpyrimidine/phosphomethylpyrimidine kinase